MPENGTANEDHGHGGPVGVDEEGEAAHDDEHAVSHTMAADGSLGLARATSGSTSTASGGGSSKAVPGTANGRPRRGAAAG
jgi:hypothetical protein